MIGFSRPAVASLGICLAFVAGSVDAVGLVAMGRFSSHMTGTTTHFMSDLTASRIAVAWLALSVLACFLGGALLCGGILASYSKQAASRALSVVIGLEACVILAGGLMLMYRISPAINLFALAMGLQNAVSSHLLAPYRRTTHLTSTLTDLGSEIGLRLRAALGPAPANSSAAPAANILFSSTAVIVGFCLGAGTASIGIATIGSALAPALAVVPALAAVMVARAGT